MNISEETGRLVTEHVRALEKRNLELELKCKEYAARNAVLLNRVRELEAKIHKETVA